MKNVAFLSSLLVLTVALILNQFARIQFGSIAISLIDISVVFLLISRGNLVKEIKKHQLSKSILYFEVACLLSLLLNIFNFQLVLIVIGSLYFMRWIVYSSVVFKINAYSKRHQRYLVNSMVTIGVFLLLLGFLQYVYYDNLQNLYYLGWDKHLYRLFTTFLDPNFAGAFFSLFSVLLAELIFVNFNLKHTLRLIGYSYLFTITCLALFLTYSRSALLMFLFIFIIYFFLKRKLRFIFGIVMLLLIYFMIASTKFSVEGFNLLRSVSSEARLATSSEAITIFLHNPIIGIGFNTYRYEQVKYGYRSIKGASISHSDAGVDNSFLFILATTGIVGFLFYFNLLYAICSYLYKKKTSFSIIALSSLFGLLIDSIFINSLFYPFFMIWLWCLIGLRDYM